MENVKNIIFYGSFLVFPLLLLLFYKRKKLSWVSFVFLCISLLLFVYARFMEPQVIITRETDISVWFDAKVILTSDLHLGRYKWEQFLERVVKKINTLDADAVFIAGDLTYEPDISQLESLFESLQNINKPVYWVLGNHDVERPGPKLRTELITALDKKNIHFLNNDIVDMWNYTLVWLGSHWSNEDDVDILDDFSQDDNILVLMHNPDTLSKINHEKTDLYLAGHTHAWQIRIPWLYKKVIPTVWNYDVWLTQETMWPLYISSWLGEIWLPMRFLNPPVIDLLHLK